MSWRADASAVRFSVPATMHSWKWRSSRRNALSQSTMPCASWSRNASCAADRTRKGQQLSARRGLLAAPGLVGPIPDGDLVPAELRAAIVLFASLLDERQRRLYAGLESQTRLADPYGLKVTICHYPSGASKWNPIDYRLFSEISKNWAGHPLHCYETTLNHIRTTTATGLQVSALLVDQEYPRGVKITDAEFASIAPGSASSSAIVPVAVTSPRVVAPSNPPSGSVSVTVKVSSSSSRLSPAVTTVAGAELFRGDRSIAKWRISGKNSRTSANSRLCERELGAQAMNPDSRPQ